MERPNRSPPETIDEQRSDQILLDTLSWARNREYRGWDYGDGGSSKLLQWAPVENKWLNLAVQELAKRPPINVRHLLLIEQRRNYKGTALFTMANMNVARLRDGTPDTGAVAYESEARSLLDWLLKNRSVGYSGFCGGHKHPIQLLSGRGVPNDPDVVSTSYAVKALLAARDLDEEYPATAETAADFVETDLNYREVDGGAKINYHMNHPDDCFTINAAALGARLFADLYAHFGENEYREKARKILDYIASKQTSLGGWYYRDPPKDSHLSMDNHHNAFVAESFIRYRDCTGSDRYDDVVDRAMTFFRERLFEPNGAPNWDEDSAYPKDIHAAANGILLFTYAGDLEFARRILDWTIENLYVGDGRFYFRKHRFYTKRVTLMRWCQAWMAFAISELRAAERDDVARVGERIDLGGERWIGGDRSIEVSDL
jgi:hypothetical protein